MKTTTLTSLALALVLGTSLNTIACGGSDDSAQPRDGAGGDGGASGTDACDGKCTAPTECNTISKQCLYNNSACSSCGTGTYCDTSSSPVTCKTNPNNSGCGSSCGAGTTCLNGSCVAGNGGSGTDSCGNMCGSGTYCSAGKCLPNSGTTCTPACTTGYTCVGTTCVSNGTGGSGGGSSTGISITWKPSLSSSVLGWVDATSTTDGSFTPGQTVKVTSADGVSAVCSILYGPNNVLVVTGGNAIWVDTLKSQLAAKHGKNADDLSYVAGLQGLKDSAFDLLACNLVGYSSCSSEFFERANGTGSWVDSEPVPNDASQIACALVRP